MFKINYINKNFILFTIKKFRNTKYLFLYLKKNLFKTLAFCRTFHGDGIYDHSWAR